MFKRLKKFVVLAVCIVVSICAILSGLAFVLFKDNAYKAEYHTALSAAAYTQSRKAGLGGDERKALLETSYQEMITALRYDPYNAVNWRRLASIIRLGDGEDGQRFDKKSLQALAHIDLVLQEFETLQENRK